MTSQFIISPEDSAADSTALTLRCTDSALPTSTQTALRHGGLCFALSGALLFGGGLAYTQYSPTAARPIVVSSAASSGTGLVNTAIRREEVGADKKSELLALIGSWQGDDFEECLSVVYETRSIVEHADVPA